MLWLCILLPRLAPEASAGGRPQAERAALELLALWALQWSSQVSIDPADSAGHGPALWIEIGASSRLFGGHAALRERIAADLAPLGYTHRLGTAPTPAGAALLARAGLATVATTRTQLRQQLAPLPLTLLALPDESLAALQDAGLQCIGELLALPTAAIAQRFGPGASLYLQRLCGEAREPLRMVRPPQRFASRCEFADPVTDTTALLFPLQRLLAAVPPRALRSVSPAPAAMPRSCWPWPVSGSPRAPWTPRSTDSPSKPTSSCSPRCCKATCFRAPHSTPSSSSR